MKKYNIFMEKFWMIIAIVSFVYGVYSVGKFGLLEAGLYLLMPLIAGTLFYLRYYTRKRMEKENDQDS
ncbi:hypothetical protein OAB13_00255 [Salibacteraceae bacterium]|nr:hypothetical protein [Salibacteraceae bacterium]MDC1304710.1 hypothetical protein [Salibacteraceae bacterium]